ncbi:MAG: MlaD family protein [Candidatus Kapabacteria bacterium]|nr:MlaD family protein [Candidatus Kapabacteria bacterium]MDW8011896.1 MlaD family protein [Bacteroidota bacterium]
MSEQQRLELKVGLITLGAIALFLLGITWARGVRVGGAERELRIRFPQAAGLEVGAPVFVNGVRQGSVVGIELQGATVLVDVRLAGNVRLARDASARIGLQELTGGRKIDIFPGTASEALPPGAEIPGTAAPDVAELLVTLGRLSEELQRFTARLDTAVARLLTTEAQQQLRQTIADVAVTARLLREFSERYRETLGQGVEDVTAIAAELRELLSRNRLAVESTLANLQQLSAAAGRTLGNADTLIAELRSTSARLAALLDRLSEGRSIASRLLYDEEFARQADSALALIRSFLGQIQQHGVNVNVRLGTRP